ncbi:branched-chain amino acid transport system II carrier protein [Levilactobacillus spicheri]|uniref:Branched-chain amino acid transport system carrier protein n=2 Tax=Levilactobacillus spicheri TaxID=216463 RepID=A0ABQ0WVK1_9LACO|nr:branched-chain amino acid transport system II carrier protein [Levilactobacillus spicheri]KRL48551.1 branched-chain amino acid permease [Levilactobacillus spicheri DSM 15429]GEO67750.1 branched-chain amino acid transport system carrier protein [Levilactobacillus spicheri]
MKTRLTWRELLFIGTMLFGLFFGAGNLIFPIYLGQQAGGHVWAAIGGLLISGIGLPLLGVTGMGLTRSTGVFDLASKVNRPFAYAFTVLLYLTLGPFSALPRLATTSFQIGVAPFVPTGLQTGVLAGFSGVFFLVAWLLARHPGKLMTYIGKWLTPFFLILLAIIMGAALLHPLGSIGGVSHGEYALHPVLNGFTEGYNTLDALAALAFGVVVIDSIRDLGVTDSSHIARYTIKAGAISMSLMAVIYTLLALIGTMSLGHFKLAANGGITLAQIANYYFGIWGNLLLALLVIIACLKTAIGLISAFGDTLSVLFPRFSYAAVTAFAAILPCLFANVGLTKLIAYSNPILLFLYPLAIVLILLAVLSPLLGTSRWLFGLTVLLTLLPAFGSAASGLPSSWQHTGFFQAVIQANAHLPLATGGFSWVVPALVGALLGWGIGKWRDPRPTD